jgi:hypothetical protein
VGDSADVEDPRRYEPATAIDHRGSRYVLGRTDRDYAIWEIAGGGPVRTFALTDAGWASAWTAFRALEAERPPDDGLGPMGPDGLGPMGPDVILARAARVYRTRLRTVLGLAATVLVPFQVASYLLAITTARRAEALIGPDRLPVLVTPDWVGWLTTSISVLVVTPLLTAALLGPSARAGPATVREAIRAVSPRAPSVVGVSILSGVAVAAAALPFAVAGGAVRDANTVAGTVLVVLGALPGIYLAVRWLLAPLVVADEGTGGTGAMRRSWALIGERWWRALGVVVVGMIVLLGVGLLVSAIFLGVVLRAGLTPATLALLTLLGTAASTFTLPFLSLLVVHLYLDARAREPGA